MTERSEQEPPSAEASTGQTSETPLSDGEPRATEHADGGNTGVTECNGGRRSRLNFWLDATAALTFSAMVGSAILLEFVLPHRGGGTWLGWSRHDWGEVHLWLGVALLTLIVVHLILHRDWIA